MNNLYFSILPVISLVAIVGIGLAAGIGMLRRLEPKQYQQLWLKIAILLTLVLTILSLSAFGKWGTLILVLFISYVGWTELIQAVHKKYGEATVDFLLPTLGTLATLGGLGNNCFTIHLGVIAASWIAIILPILITRRPSPMHRILTAAFGMLMVSLPLAYLLALGSLSYELFIFLIMLVMSNDGFSEIFGRFLGRIPLCPDISPNKTWEGAIGGFFSCLATSYMLKFLVPNWQTWEVLLVAAGTSLMTLSGDLIFSSLKREAGIKDFGSVLSVTGGILDKFDGLIFVVPIFYIVAHEIGI